MRKGKPEERNKISGLGPLSMNPPVPEWQSYSRSNTARENLEMKSVSSFTVQDCLLMGWLPLARALTYTYTPPLKSLRTSARFVSKVERNRTIFYIWQMIWSTICRYNKEVNSQKVFVHLMENYRYLQLRGKRIIRTIKRIIHTINFKGFLWKGEFNLQDQ